MQNTENLWDKAKKIGKPAILATLGALITGIAIHFDIPLESQKAQQPEQTANSSSPSATGIQGGVNIHNNYSPQPPAPQPVVQPTPTNIQKMGDDITNSPQINGSNIIFSPK
jgi:hypothetical protein